jgi:hypothetical protein
MDSTNPPVPCHGKGRGTVSVIWRYQFIATRFNRAGAIIIDDGEFRAERVEDAMALLSSVARNIKPSRDTRPDVVRLVDAAGREVMRLPLGDREPEPEALAG